MMYFCDEWNREVYEVVCLPLEDHTPPCKRRVHDVGTDPKNWYYVYEDRLQPTKKLAIWAAQEALEIRDRESADQMQELQRQRDEIARLLSRFENDGT